MYIRNKKNNRIVFSSLLTAMLMASLVMPGDAATKSFSFNSSRGLRVMILKSSHIPFIHAQLLIYYNEEIKNPAAAYLTLLNIFDKNISNPDTPVLSALKKLGNDFEVEQRPDFLIFKINFLPGKMQTFNRFLKALYNYRPFLETGSRSYEYDYAQRKKQNNTLDRYKNSIAGYWKYFLKKKEWKKKIAYQLAYHHLFPSHILGNTLITPDALKEVTLDRLRDFYRRTYKLSNSRLIIKGNFETPAVVFGSIERTLSTFKKQRPRKYAGQKLTISNKKKVIIFNTNDTAPPTLFWFETVSTVNNRTPVPSMVLNSVLFGFPTGRLFLNARYHNINNIRLQSEMTNHLDVSVICNTVRLRYRDIESFILMVEREKKKLRIKRVGRKEYLDNLSHIYGSLKVNTQDFETDVSNEVFDPLYRTGSSNGNSNITLAGLNQVIDNSHRKSGIIVIVGNAKMVLSSLTILRTGVQVMDFGI